MLFDRFLGFSLDVFFGFLGNLVSNFLHSLLKLGNYVFFGVLFLLMLFDGFFGFSLDVFFGFLGNLVSNFLHSLLKLGKNVCFAVMFLMSLVEVFLGNKLTSNPSFIMVVSFHIELCIASILSAFYSTISYSISFRIFHHNLFDTCLFSWS